MTDEELARLKAIAFGNLEGMYDETFWQTPKNVQALILEVERLRGQSEPEGDPMPDMAHLDVVQLRRIIARHVRFREEAVRLLQQVDTGYEGEWPEIRQFLERVNARLVLAQNREPPQ